MNVTALKVGSIPISFTTGFEAQGFAVTDVTGLSDYGEHKMGVPGSTDVVITGVVLPGATPMSIRAYIFSSINPYESFMLEAMHGPSGPVFQALAAITSVKCNMHDVPSSITVTILRRSGWYGAPAISLLTNEAVTEIPGTFEFVAPITLEIQLTSYFSLSDLHDSHLTVSVGEKASITVDFERLISTISGTVVGLFDGSIIRITNSLDYHACLIADGRVYDLPVLGKVVSGMIPVSTNPEVLLVQTGMPSTCSVAVAITTRETYLTI